MGGSRSEVDVGRYGYAACAAAVGGGGGVRALHEDLHGRGHVTMGACETVTRRGVHLVALARGRSLWLSLLTI